MANPTELPASISATTRLPRVVRGSGSYLYDAAGKQYIDGSGGPLVYCIGHGNAEVNAAIPAPIPAPLCRGKTRTLPVGRCPAMLGQPLPKAPT